MTTDTLHPLAADYLKRLQNAGRGLPPERIRELGAEIEAHLAEAIEPGATDAQVLTVLDKLGPPEAIIAAESPETEDVSPRSGLGEWAAIALLLFGGFIFGIGWLAGLVLLWNSRVWTTRDKLIGTLVVPGGLAISLPAGLILLGTPTKILCRGIAAGPQHCTAMPGSSIASPAIAVAVIAVLVLAPIATAVYLARRA
jgi:hypothetical protein